jgi:hypothetical protein
MVVLLPFIYCLTAADGVAYIDTRACIFMCACENHQTVGAYQVSSMCVCACVRVCVFMIDQTVGVHQVSSI